MNKQLLAIAVGAALGTAPLMSHAGVKWYGQLQAEVASESSDFVGDDSFDGHVIENSGRLKGDDTSVSDNKRGRLGVKVSEDLGGGLKAIAKFEYQVSTTDADVDDGNRNSFVGLKGGFGAIKIGSLKSPYKYYGGVKYDPFVTTEIEARRYGGMTRGQFGSNGFFNDSISYTTPKMNGFQGWVVYTPDEEEGRDGDYALGVKYGTKMWEIFGATAHDDDNNTDPTDDSFAYDAFKFGGKVKFGDFTVLGQYETTTQETSVGDEDGEIIFLGGHFKVGKAVLVAQYGIGTVEFPGAAPDQESDYYALGGIYKFSKKTRLFGGYGNSSIDNADGDDTVDGDRNALTVGMRIDF